MNALALALALAMGPVDAAEDRIPRSLADTFVEPAAPKEEMSFMVGGHLGVAGAYDGDDPCFVIGGVFRVANILPWLSAEGSIDFQTKQGVDDGAAKIFQVPFMFAALLYPPLDIPVHPYGIVGFGFTITDVSGPGVKDDTDPNMLVFIGFGADYELSPGILLDANVRFVFAGDPPHHGDFSADWAQFTVGILFRLGK